MSFTNGLITAPWLFLGGAIYLLALGFALRNTPWRVFLDNKTLQHMLGGATVLLVVLWSMRAGISPGLGIHFLGVTMMTLIFGWDLAILSGTVALLSMGIIGRESWDSLFLSGVCSILFPVAITCFVHRFVDKKLSKNFFVFLFLCGFFGAGLSSAGAGLLASSVLVLDGVYSLEKVFLEYLRYLPLIMFPEGLMNGIILTGMLVFHPDWVRGFDAKAYIDDQ